MDDPIGKVVWMAMQSLYRRYRPRRFAELRGQEHVVRALRNAVINEREGQAYLFSGPRGTGKTSTARILAKVLNCQNPADGEPCCICASCLAVDNGTSYDVLELDAASNNGVDEIRDIIETASTLSPGRHRVFILDEVHMLSKAASAALLKTLEEPPPNVVFVLATTDPQKVTETIRSRVQHLVFHLLSVDELEKYVRWVMQDADLTVNQDAIEWVVQEGNGSARDTLSALELVVAGGGTVEASISLDEFLEALIERDQGRALAAVAFAIQQGLDPRNLADDLVRALRDAFLSLMSPELLQVPQGRAEEISLQALRLGAAMTVRAMEVLGTALVDMRHAPDPRLLLEVAVVRLASPALDDSMGTLMTRLQILEDAVRDLKENGMTALPPAPVDPATGRAMVGGRAVAQDITAPIAPVARVAATPATPTTPITSAAPTTSVAPAEIWPQVLLSVKQIVKAIYNPTSIVAVDGNVVTIAAPNTSHMARCKAHIEDIETAISKLCGAKYTVQLTADATASRGIERPSKEAIRTIVDEVKEDPYTPIDPALLIEGPANISVSVDRLKGVFPGATIVPDDKKKK